MEWLAILKDMLNQVIDAVKFYLPNLMTALVVLFIGWILSKLIGNLIERIARRTGLMKKLMKAVKPDSDDKDEDSKEDAKDEKDTGARVLGKVVYWFLFICVIAITVNILNIPVISELLEKLFTNLVGAIPRILYAFLILAVAWIIAMVLRFIIRTFLTSIQLEDKLAHWGVGTKLPEREAEEDETEQREARVPIAETISKLVFYLVLLFALPGVLSALEITAVAEPIKEMLQKLIAMLPNIFGAALTILIGWIVARIVREIVTNFLVAVGLDRALEKLGTAQAVGGVKVSRILGTIVYVIILISFVTSALDNIKWKAISDPVKSMLDKFLGMFPSILAAIVILTIGYVFGKIIGDFISRLLGGVGFDKILSKIGLGSLEEKGKEGLSLSGIAGKVVMYIILVFALTEAFEVLNLKLISQLFSEFLLFLPKLFIGILILGVGFAVAQIVFKMLSAALEGSTHVTLLSNAAKYGIVTFAFFMALQQIGFGESIITTAFTALFGAFCLAAALAFGLGAREIAAQYLQERFGKPTSQGKKKA
ncbi:mechanosensitive ion channel [Acidobacteriota bacterium]